MSFPESADLYQACRSADPTRQTPAYRALWSYLYPVTYQLLRDQADADDLAQECTQRALVRIHQRLLECREPNAFRTWARRIAANLALDELRQRRRLTALPDEEAAPSPLPYTVAAPEASVLATMQQDELRALLIQSPMSDRSRRAVIGRYLDDHNDEELAQKESALAGVPILPSHLQVTRAKNIAKLRQWEPLRAYLT